MDRRSPPAPAAIGLHGPSGLIGLLGPSALLWLLAGCILIENPAYKSTGTSAADDTTSADDDSSTGEPLCPDGQPPRDWYPDADGDTHGDRNAEPVTACDPPTGSLEDHGDCKDDVPSVHPGADEICNDRDDDCDALIDGKQCGACKVETTEEFVYWICPVPEGEPAYPWAAARTRCNAFGNKYPVDLASLHDDAEYARILETVQAYFKQGDDGRHHAWLGLTKSTAHVMDCDTPDPKTVWEWSDATPVDYTRWNPDEPSGTDCMCGAPMCPRSLCVELSIDVQAEEFGWNDTPCDDKLVRGFVCKGERDPDLFPDIGS